MTYKKNSSTPVRTAFIAGCFTIVASLIAGVFLLANTALEKQWFTSVPTATQYVQNTPTPDQDSISYFRVVQASPSEITIEVDYTYNPARGSRVYVAACFQSKGIVISNCQVNESLLPTVGSGTVRVTVRPLITSPMSSDEIIILLYEYGKEKSPFITKTFPFQHDWQP